MKCDEGGFWSMKKSKKAILTVLFFVICMLVGTTNVWAGSVKNLAQQKKESFSTKVDMTGDGKKDTITFNLIRKTGMTEIDQMQVQINNKVVLTKKNLYSMYINVNYIYMSKNREFLEINVINDFKQQELNRLYRYDSKKKKLVKVLDLKNITGYESGRKVVKATSSEITVMHGCQPYTVGYAKWYCTYIYKNGKFKLKTKVVPVKSITHANNKFVIQNTTSFYKTAGGKTVSFVAYPGTVVEMKKIKMSGSNFYIQFKTGNKTGWILDKMCNNKNGPFADIRLAGGPMDFRE